MTPLRNLQAASLVESKSYRGFAALQVELLNAGQQDFVVAERNSR